MRTLWYLWKLSRQLEKARGEMRAACLQVVVEAGAGFEERKSAAKARGEELQPRTAYEVSYWRDRHEAMTGTATKRGATLAEALRGALR